MAVVSFLSFQEAETVIPPPCPESGKGSFAERIGKGRSDTDETGMTLQEHFGNSGTTTPVAVHLEGGMGTEEVGVSAPLVGVVES